MRKMFAAVLLASVALADGDAKAAPGPIGQWLMDQPVTLWDRGMDAMDDEAKSLYDIDSDEWLVGGTVKLFLAGAHYHWDNNEIQIGTWFRGVEDEIFIDHNWCNYVRHRVIERVLGIATRSGMDEAAAEIWTDAATEIIADWFSHAGFQNTDRDKVLGAKMARIIFVQVGISADFGSGIQCRDRIMSLDAPSKPLP